MRRKNWELKGIFWIITLLFVGFLAAPILLLLGKSLVGEGGFTWEFYASVVTREGFLTALGNSFAVAAASAVTATVIAFLMAYAVHYTGLPRWAKRLITAIATLPMFLPTITYGFAIIYSFGKQGLLTRLLGRQFFDIYGFGGLLVGYVIYTIPVAFLLIHNTMGFVDKKTIIVSKAMGDRDLATFWIAILRPLRELWRAPSFRPSSCASPTSASPPQWAAAMRSSPPSSTTRCWAASPTSTGGRSSP